MNSAALYLCKHIEMTIKNHKFPMATHRHRSRYNQCEMCMRGDDFGGGGLFGIK